MKLSLNRILWMMAGLVLLIAVTVGMEESYQIHKAREVEIEKNLVYHALETSDRLVGHLEKIHRYFNDSVEIDRHKLLKAVHYFDRMDRELLPMQKALNENLLFGRYDLYLIDRNRTIRRATFPMDIGLDFHGNSFAMKVFDMVEKRVIPYHISQPFYQPPSNDFRRYLLALSSDGSFFVQISHNYSPKADFDDAILRILKRNPEIRSLELYYLANGMFNAFQGRGKEKNKKDYFRKLDKEKRQFLRRFSEDLRVNLDLDALMRDPMAVHRYFDKNRIHYRIDSEEERAIVYTASENAFNDQLNKEMIILRMVYDLSPIYARYHASFIRLVVVLVVSVLILWAMIYLIKVLLVDRIREIVEALKHHQKITLYTPEIVEFRELADAVEGYRHRLVTQNRELEILTLTDPLTGAYNRRHFSGILEEKIRKCTENPDQKFALVIFDIDNFKPINDRYGHDTGDRVLGEVARHIHKSLKKDELFFRIGGEEFALLIDPLKRREAAAERAEELRRSVASVPFGPDLRITVSAGVTVMEKGDDAVSLFRRADKLLYHSKRAGKNRVSSDDTMEE